MTKSFINHILKTQKINMNLFVVTSPFQYLCANEARAFFQCTNNILLLVNQDTEGALRIQNKIVEKEKWTHVIRIKRNNRTIAIPKAINQIKKILGKSSIETFFYSEYSGLRTKLLLRNLDFKKEVYFDDGALTFLDFEKHIKPQTTFYRPRFFQDLIIRLAGCKPIGMLPPSKNLEFFTIFNLGKNDFICHQNNFTQLISKYGQPNIYYPSAPVGFIGRGAIGDKNQPSIREYIEELESIAKKVNKKLLYFPHRTERESVRKELMKNPHIIYHQSEYPLEIELIEKNLQLSAFIGDFSTVMFTCRKFSPMMPLYILSDKHKVKLIQRYIREQIEIIDMKKFYDYF